MTLRRGRVAVLAGALKRLIPKLMTAFVLLVLAAIALYNLTANFTAMNISEDREAYQYASGVMDPLPRDAVVFAEGDREVFSLIYYRQAVLGGRSSAVVVSQGLLQYEWYYENLRRAMSEVTFAPLESRPDHHARAVEIASVTFAEGRAVCFTDSSPLLPEFEYEPRGKCSCIVAQKQ